MANWKRIFAAAAVALVVMLGLFLIIVAMQPGEFRITRSATMKAAPATVFAEVNDFHKWEAWSPWAKLDPNAKAVFAGPESGEGAKFSWSGNDKVGEGTQTIVESKPEERIRIRLDFEKPMKDTSEAEFTFKPQDDQTQVTWSMSGKKNFVGKAVCMFMNMDKMIGGEFDKGLASLKRIVEKPAETVSAGGSEEKPNSES
ncbi:MAG TPA: SRPBCC family protein [Pirellulaceae bacterium]|jgi:hypothetical protein